MRRRRRGGKALARCATGSAGKAGRAKAKLTTDLEEMNCFSDFDIGGDFAVGARLDLIDAPIETFRVTPLNISGRRRRRRRKERGNADDRWQPGGDGETCARQKP